MTPLLPDQRLWFPYTAPTPKARLRLLCFSYAGGGATIFRAWPGELAPEVEVLALQLPGREGRLREAPFTRLDDLIPAVAQAIRPLLDHPFALFGHSMGALVAFELTRHLRREELPLPRHLFVSAHRAPQLPRKNAPIHELPEPKFIEEIRGLEGTPEEVFQAPELLELVIPLLRADFAVCERYHYQEETPLALPISALGGLEDSEISRDDIHAWRAQTTGPFRARLLPGGHFFLHTQRPLLLEVILRDLHS